MFGISLKLFYASQSNERRIAWIAQALQLKYPETSLELQTIVSHQQLAVAPVYYIARFGALLYVFKNACIRCW